MNEIMVNTAKHQYNQQNIYFSQKLVENKEVLTAQ